jgi:hypothetical protein
MVAGMTLATQFDIEDHQVVVLTGDGGFCLLAGEPLLDGDYRLGREDPLLELMAGGRIVFDDRDLEHGAFSKTACRKYPRFLRSKHSRRVSVCSHDGRNGNAPEEILTAREQTDPASALNLPRHS